MLTLFNQFVNFLAVICIFLMIYLLIFSCISTRSIKFFGDSAPFSAHAGAEVNLLGYLFQHLSFSQQFYFLINHQLILLFLSCSFWSSFKFCCQFAFTVKKLLTIFATDSLRKKFTRSFQKINSIAVKIISFFWFNLISQFFVLPQMFEKLDQWILLQLKCYQQYFNQLMLLQ